MARNCVTCGRANTDDALFCSGCGAPVTPPVPVVPTPPPVWPAPPAVAATPSAAFAPPAAAPTPPPAGPAPPAFVPPPPGPGAFGAPPRGPHKGAPVWLVVVIVLAVVAIAAVAALLLLPLGDGGGDESPTPVASTSVTPTPGESQYLAAAVGPRANRLATVAADGTTKELMTFNGRDIYQIAYSPDGRWLACIAGTYKRSDVWLYEAGAVAPERVAVATPAVLAIDSIAWLSAGELLIAGYTVAPESTGENAAFVVCDPVTRSIVPLEDSAGVALRGVSVSASRDGTKVAFVTYTDQKSNEYGMPTATERLKLLDRASGAVAELGSGEAFFDVNARRFDDPLLSPAGNALIYRRAGSDVGTSYTVIDANGATLMPEKETEFPAGYAWDPGGTKVVFTGHSLKPADNESGVGPAIFWVFDLEVGGPAQVIARYKDTMVQELSWSPDGASIAWAEYDQEKYRTGLIYLTSAGGGDAELLTKDALSPVWAPDAGAGLQTSPSTSP